MLQLTLGNCRQRFLVNAGQVGFPLYSDWKREPFDWWRKLNVNILRIATRVDAIPTMNGQIDSV